MAWAQRGPAKLRKLNQIFTRVLDVQITRAPKGGSTELARAFGKGEEVRFAWVLASKSQELGPLAEMTTHTVCGEEPSLSLEWAGRGAGPQEAGACFERVLLFFPQPSHLVAALTSRCWSR